MAGFRHPWALCGGWAADAWLGSQTRDHGDVDIVVFDDDQHALFEYLAGWHTLGGPDSEPHIPWDGSWLTVPAHIHARPPGMDGTPGMGRDGFDLELILNARLGEDWLISNEPHITRPVAESMSVSPAGVPALLPEVLMFFKATAYPHDPRFPRPIDRTDFIQLVPLLSREQRRWLSKSMEAVWPGHPWLELISG